MASTRTVVVHFASQLTQFGSAAANPSVGLPAVELILLASLISAVAAFIVFKRATVKRFIGLIRTKTLIRAKKD